MAISAHDLPTLRGVARCGGSLKIEAAILPVPDLIDLANICRDGNVRLTIVGSDALSATDMMNIARAGSLSVSFE